MDTIYGPNLSIDELFGRRSVAEEAEGLDSSSSDAVFFFSTSNGFFNGIFFPELADVCGKGLSPRPLAKLRNIGAFHRVEFRREKRRVDLRSVAEASDLEVLESIGDEGLSFDHALQLNDDPLRAVPFAAAAFHSNLHCDDKKPPAAISSFQLSNSKEVKPRLLQPGSNLPAIFLAWQWELE
ncbi:hypothetical protein ACLOJK_024527 [Asimina triloba]